MPTVLRLLGFRFFFYSLENGEPRHIHVAQADRTAKYWFERVELARSEGFRAHELNKMRLLVETHAVEFRRRWDEHFGS